MSRFVISTAMVAALLSTTALVTSTVLISRSAMAGGEPAAGTASAGVLPSFESAFRPTQPSAAMFTPQVDCNFSASANCAGSATRAASPSRGKPAQRPLPPPDPAPAARSLINPPPATAQLQRAGMDRPAVAATLLPLAAMPMRRDEPAAEEAPRRAATRLVDSRDVTPPQNTMVLEAGMGRVLHLNGNTTSVFAADPKVAEVRPASANSLFVFGVAPGHTTVAAMDASGQPIAQYDVTVTPSSYGASAARGEMNRAMPGRDLRLDTTGNGMDVRGQVGSASDAERAMQIGRSFMGPGQVASNRMDVKSGLQVNLRVRIIEMSRNLTRDLGVNWSAVGKLYNYTLIGATANMLSNLTTPTSVFGVGPSKGTGINAVIDALAQDQMIHMLAEPNLTAMSGETASFLVGGEFPIPVAQQNNQTTIEFKQYGVSLAFVPTVVSDGHISLKVRPEVSQLTTQGAVQLSAGNSTIQIPAISVRRAETTVELGSGQSFAIAGLLQDSSTISDSSLPFLGDLPILGALFRSDAYQRNETELVIIVTPYIVSPVSNPAALARPDDGKPVPNDAERLLLLRQTGRPPAAAPISASRAAINAGFVVQ